VPVGCYLCKAVVCAELGCVYSLSDAQVCAGIFMHTCTNVAITLGIAHVQPDLVGLLCMRAILHRQGCHADEFDYWLDLKHYSLSHLHVRCHVD